MHPAALMAGGGEPLRERRPETLCAVADGQLGRPSHCAGLQAEQHLWRARGRLTGAVLNGVKTPPAPGVDDDNHQGPQPLADAVGPYMNPSVLVVHRNRPALRRFAPCGLPTTRQTPPLLLANRLPDAATQPIPHRARSRLADAAHDVISPMSGILRRLVNK